MGQVLLNALQYSKHGAGISNYTKNLVDNLIYKDNIDFILSKGLCDKYEGYSDKIQFVKDINSSKERIIYEQIKCLSLYKDYDIVHFPDYATPILSKAKKVATIHDMAFLSVKECYTKSQVATKRFLLENTIKSADKLICISKFTYSELKKYYPELDESKIEIIYNGFNKPIIQNVDLSLDKFSINGDYILFVGTISPSKNLVRLIKAFKEVSKIHTNIKLVIVGKDGWKFEEVYEVVEKNNLNNKVIFTGYVTNEELETLYYKSMFVVYPSLYEGFGLPPLEALSRNKPVLVSDIEVLKEILGDSAFYCNPYSVQDIANQIINLITNKEYRNSKIDLAEKTVNKYSWEKCAIETYKVYEKLKGEI